MPKHDMVPEVVTGGSIVVDSHNGWLVYEKVLEVTYPNSTGTLTTSLRDYYDAGGVKVPRVVHVKRRNILSDGTRVSIDVKGTYNLTTNHVGLSESDFTLSAFGFPEPFGIEWERPIPWGLYIIGGTLGMVVVMGVVWRIRRWRAAA
jgi:hypothetical protein